MILRLMLPLLLALFSVPGWAAGDAFFQPSLGDFREELATARSEGKRGVLLVFEQDNCAYCRRFREQVLSRDGVQRWYRAHFTVLAVDVLGAVAVNDVNGQATDERGMARRYAVRATPTLVFVDTRGEVVLRHAGAPRDAESFLLLGRFVAEGAVANMTFDQFRRLAQAGRSGRSMQ